MELTFPQIEVESSTKFKTSSFHIGDLRVIIDILRSKMYSDAIKTLVCEIASNARDANREVSKDDTPIEINAPSSDDLIFSVRDNGPGISPDRMVNVFLAYGCSTKRTDNNQTGGFGLGAKSPFAYTDQFIIITTTIENSIATKREYIAYIDSSRIGSIALVSEKPSSEPTGTTIKVSVNLSDVFRFGQAIRASCSYWNPLPIVTSKAPFEFDSIHKKHDEYCEDDWFFTNNNSEAIALLDGIPYTIKVDKLTDIPNTKLHGINRSGLVVRFKTGDLMITANREEIDYQDETRKFLAEKLTYIYDYINKKIQDEINTCNRYVDAVRLLNSKRELNQIISPKMWKTAVVSETMRGAHDYYLRSAEYSSDVPTKFTTQIVEKQHYISGLHVIALSNRTTLDRNKLHKYYEDTQNRANKLVIIMPKDKTSIIPPAVLDMVDINLKDIKADKKTKVVITGTKCGKITRESSDKITRDCIDINTGGYYVESCNSDTVVVESETLKKVSEVSHLLSKLGILKVNVFTELAIKSLPQNWKPLISLVRFRAKELLAEHDVTKYLDLEYFQRQSRYNWVQTIRNVDNYVLDPHSPWHTYSKLCTKKYVEPPESIQDIRCILRFAGQSHESDTSKLSKLHKLITKLYSPILSGHYEVEEMSKIINIVDYIRQTNRVRGIDNG